MIDSQQSHLKSQNIGYDNYTNSTQVVTIYQHRLDQKPVISWTEITFRLPLSAFFHSLSTSISTACRCRTNVYHVSATSVDKVVQPHQLTNHHHAVHCAQPQHYPHSHSTILERFFSDICGLISVTYDCLLLSMITLHIHTVKQNKLLGSILPSINKLVFRIHRMWRKLTKAKRNFWKAFFQLEVLWNLCS